MSIVIFISSLLIYILYLLHSVFFHFRLVTKC
nr:MAG TPA: hypothetical protein [Caudoviricetes sp.]